jgi:UDP-N-acetylmuramoylalanine--D-glutamate ligase
MLQDFSVHRRRVTVAGAGSSGLAAAELLVRRGAYVTLSEERASFEGADRLGSLGVTVERGGHADETFAGADLVVLSPGVSPDRPVVAAARTAGVPVIGELELASRWLQGRIIAITGTKGKSTTTTLTGRMLQSSGRTVLVGGNIGVPLSAQVDGSTPETLHVVEASSFQLETTDTFHPWIAAVLNFSPDHLDRHPGIEAYAAAKAAIFANQQPDDWAVVNADDEGAQSLASGARARRTWFGTADVAEGITVAAGHVVERTGRGERTLVPTSAIRVLGRHMLSDVLAATAVSRLAGATAEGVAEAVSTFTGLEHAMENAGEIEGVRFVNDSKATNVAAARYAVESVEGGLVAIMGGRFKGGNLADLRAPLRDRARAVVAIGEAAPLVADAFADVVPVHAARTLDDAVGVAFELAKPDGTVVLAPACASFDMFASYADRGRQFKEAVARLAGTRRTAVEP